MLSFALFPLHYTGLATAQETQQRVMLKLSSSGIRGHSIRAASRKQIMHRLLKPFQRRIGKLALILKSLDSVRLPVYQVSVWRRNLVFGSWF